MDRVVQIREELHAQDGQPAEELERFLVEVPRTEVRHHVDLHEGTKGGELAPAQEELLVLRAGVSRDVGSPQRYARERRVLAGEDDRGKTVAEREVGVVVAGPGHRISLNAGVSGANDQHAVAAELPIDVLLHRGVVEDRVTILHLVGRRPVAEHRIGDEVALAVVAFERACAVAFRFSDL